MSVRAAVCDDSLHAVAIATAARKPHQRGLRLRRALWLLALPTRPDERVAVATCALMSIEELPELQKSLLMIPANQGGWGLPALEVLNERAYIGGAAAAPTIAAW